MDPRPTPSNQRFFRFGGVGSVRIAAMIVPALVGIGVALRIVQYAANESLWLDEASVALSIVRRSAGDLIFSPLDYRQVAPPLFLLAANGATAILGPTEFALRLPAFVCSIAALVLFALLAHRVLDGIAVPIAVGLFALSPRLIAYAAEVKQYSGDVLAAVLLTLLALELRASGYSRQRVLAAALAGLAFVWLSQASVLILTGLGLALALLAVLDRDRRAYRALGLLAVAWGVAAAASVMAARGNMSPGGYDRMRNYWSSGFIPLPPNWRAGAVWLWLHLREAYWLGFGFPRFGGACVLVGALGAWALWRKGRRDVVLLFAAPALVTLAASAARQYPFSGRLVLFLLPAFGIALAAGAAWLSGLWGRRAPAAQLALVLLLAAGPVYTLVRYPPPWRRQEIKPVLAHIAANRRPGDGVFAIYWAARAMYFYAPRYGFDDRAWTAGGRHLDDSRANLREIDKFRGRSRVWVILSHNYSPGVHEAIVSYLERIGVRRDHVAGPRTVPGRRTDAQAFLYDLSDPARLMLSSADSHPLPGAR